MRRMIIAVVVVLVVALVAGPALAQEPRGCDKFKWPLEKEHALRLSPAAAKTASGSALDKAPATALVVGLAPFGEAKLPMPPERAPKQPSSFAGFVRIGAVPKAGPYLVTLSAEAWVDVVQGEHYVKSSGFSGALGCEGMRKSVKFDLGPGPFAVQISGAAADSILMVITSAAE